MTENDLPSHAEFVDRLRKAQQTAPATIGNEDPLLGHIASRYDLLADTMDGDPQILEALRSQLRTAINRGIAQSDLYDALTHVGLALSQNQFNRILSRQRAKPAATQQTPMTANEWAHILAPALRGAPTTTDYEAVSAPLRAWGINLSAEALQQAHQDLPREDRSNTAPPWTRILDEMGSHLIAMARIGCAVRDIAVCLAHRHLQVPQEVIAEWLERTLQMRQYAQARRATEHARDPQTKAHELMKHRFTVTVDPVLSDPYRVTVICPSTEAASFARKWIDAGIRALTAQIPNQTPGNARTPRSARPTTTRQEPPQTS